MTYEYKTVGAPEKGKRKRGLRTQSDRVAAAFEEILEEEAVDGWEYLRTDLLPVTERSGWFSRSQEVHRAVMVFRRPSNWAEVERDAILQRAPSVSPPPAATTLQASPAPSPAAAAKAERLPKAEPVVGENPDLRIAEIVRGPVSKGSER